MGETEEKPRKSTVKTTRP